jgi:hypothetical protein
VEVDGSDKRTSLQCYSISYDRKKFPVDFHDEVGDKKEREKLMDYARRFEKHFLFTIG